MTTVMSSSSSSSSFLSATRIAIALTCLDRYSWNLVTRVIDRKGTLGCDQFGVKGHVGVTKVNDIYCVKKLKQGQMEKLNRSSCRPWWKLKSIQLHRCHMTFGFGVKGQNVQNFVFFKRLLVINKWSSDVVIDTYASTMASVYGLCSDLRSKVIWGH